MNTVNYNTKMLNKMHQLIPDDNQSMKSETAQELKTIINESNVPINITQDYNSVHIDVDQDGFNNFCKYYNSDFILPFVKSKRFWRHFGKVRYLHYQNGKTHIAH